MAMLTPEQMQDGQNDGMLKPGQNANVVLVAYEPFQSKKGRTIPKYVCKDADSGARYEIVGYGFHEIVKELNDSIVPEQTVLHVKCLDNGSAFPDFEATIVTGTEKKADEKPF